MEISKENVHATLMLDPANNSCCDCGEPNPTFASVNNGVLLCANDAGTHKSFGEEISVIKSLITDEWDTRSFLYMRLGGNANFKAFLQTYNLDHELPIIKYRTKAAEYYRMRLHAKVQGVPFVLQPPTVMEGRLALLAVSDQPPIMEEAPKSSMEQKASAVGSNIAVGTVKAGHYVYEKGKVAAEYTAEKGKEFMENPAVKNMAASVRTGLSKAGDAISNTFSNMWSYLTGPSKTTEPKVYKK